MVGAGLLALAVGGWLLIAGPGGESSAAEQGGTVHEVPMRLPSGAEAVARLGVEIVAIYPHDPEAYTQGLLWHEGLLYESTGLRGASSLRQVDLATGLIRQRRDLSRTLFGEGLARVGEELIQLTWEAGRALRYDLETFQPKGEFTYSGEGWGLCFDGQRLVMSDGSDTLTFRDPKTFAVIGRIAVTLDGRPLTQLNELECVEGEVYANIWRTDRIVRIDPATGLVRAVIDATGLLPPGERAHTDVLNGIAWRPETDTFFLTGKLWPRLFEVRWIP